jgi:hypothetical protein
VVNMQSGGCAGDATRMLNFNFEAGTWDGRGPTCFCEVFAASSYETRAFDYGTRRCESIHIITLACFVVCRIFSAPFHTMTRHLREYLACICGHGRNCAMRNATH